MMQQRSPANSSVAVDATAPSASRAAQPLSALHATALYLPVPPVEYDEDGYPFADSAVEMEGDFHGNPLRYLIDALRARFGRRDDVCFASDMGLLFEKGNPRAVMVPDMFVVFGAPKRMRNSFKLWEEPKGPDFVLEVMSASSFRKDVEDKPPLYAALGVDEYWTLDPRGRRSEPIVAWRLSGAGAYEPIAAQADGSYRSAVLGLDFRFGTSGLRARDVDTGEDLLDHEESERERRSAHARAQTAEARAEAAEARDEDAQARIAELEAQLRRSEHR